jgi:hypothetical protein
MNIFKKTLILTSIVLMGGCSPKTITKVVEKPVVKPIFPPETLYKRIDVSPPPDINYTTTPVVKIILTKDKYTLYLLKQLKLANNQFTHIEKYINDNKKMY